MIYDLLEGVALRLSYTIEKHENGYLVNIFDKDEELFETFKATSQTVANSRARHRCYILAQGYPERCYDGGI